ncbi:MAG: hypothetical protein ACREMS_04070 [Gemmatimonadaceae bacterium]
MEFFHYDPYGQALSKLQRGHDRDLRDVRALVDSGLVDVKTLGARFREIEPLLTRYPAIDADSFRLVLSDFCDSAEADLRMISDETLAGLPGAGRVREGLADLAAGRQTVPALLIEVARTRLTRAGLLRPSEQASRVDAELVLYRLLRTQKGDAYTRYNALLRELVSFENALESRVRRAA